MPFTTMSSREFNQNTSGAKKSANSGPVFITDRGQPAHVLLSIDDYRKLAGRQISLAEAVAQVDGGDFDFDPPQADDLYRPADL